MARFHNGKNGPAPCRATKGKCPLGGESGSDNHYDTKEEAQKAYETQMSAKHPVTGVTEKDIKKSSNTLNSLLENSSKKINTKQEPEEPETPTPVVNNAYVAPEVSAGEIPASSAAVPPSLTATDVEPQSTEPTREQVLESLRDTPSLGESLDYFERNAGLHKDPSTGRFGFEAYDNQDDRWSSLRKPEFPGDPVPQTVGEARERSDRMASEMIPTPAGGIAAYIGDTREEAIRAVRRFSTPEGRKALVESIHDKIREGANRSPLTPVTDFDRQAYPGESDRSIAEKIAYANEVRRRLRHTVNAIGSFTAALESPKSPQKWREMNDALASAGVYELAREVNARWEEKCASRAASLGN